jgi:CubicO group peptidase (beta-lactamase class C family)
MAVLFALGGAACSSSSHESSDAAAMSTAAVLGDGDAPLASTKKALDAVAAQDLTDLGEGTALAFGAVDGDARGAWGYGELLAGSGAIPDGDTYFDIASVTKVFAGTLLGVEVGCSGTSLRSGSPVSASPSTCVRRCSSRSACIARR